MSTPWKKEELDALIEFHREYGRKPVLDDYDVTELGFEETLRVRGCESHERAVEEAALAATDWCQRVDPEKIKARATCIRTGVRKVFGLRLEPRLVELDTE